MNPDDLRAAADRATELLDAATPGPWKRTGYTSIITEDDPPRIVAVASYSAPIADAALIAAAPDLLAVLAPAARQYADTQDEVQRLRTVLDGLLDAVGDERWALNLASRLLDEATHLQRTRAGFGETVGLLSEAAVMVGRIADAAAAARGEGTDG